MVLGGDKLEFRSISDMKIIKAYDMQFHPIAWVNFAKSKPLVIISGYKMKPQYEDAGFVINWQTGEIVTKIIDESQKKLDLSPSPVSPIFTADGNYILSYKATAGNKMKRDVMKYNAATGKLIQSVTTDFINRMTATGQGQLILAMADSYRGFPEGSFYTVDIENMKVTSKSKKIPSPATALAAIDTDNVVVTPFTKGPKVYLYNLKTGDQQTIVDCKCNIEDVSVSTDKQLLFIRYKSRGKKAKAVEVYQIIGDK